MDETMNFIGKFYTVNGVWYASYEMDGITINPIPVYVEKENDNVLADIVNNWIEYKHVFGK